MPNTFTDTAGRTWLVDLTIGAARRVKNLLGVNLLDPAGGDPPLITRLHTDLELLFDVIFVTVKPQADALKLTDEQFAEAMGGDAAYSAYRAFMGGALVDFFRELKRPDVARMIERNREFLEVESAKAAPLMDEAGIVATRMAEEQRAEILNDLTNLGRGPTSSSLPASSASGPTP